MAAAAAAAGAIMALPAPATQAQAPVASGSAPPSAFALKTPWGEPDLQGIWTDEADTPLERPTKYADQEFFTDAQRQQLDRERSALLRQDRRGQRGTEADVAQAYSLLFLSVKGMGARTSKIVDPPNGRIPSVTPWRRISLPLIGSFVSLCCRQRKHARTICRDARGVNTIRRLRPNAQSARLATIRGA